MNIAQLPIVRVSLVQDCPLGPLVERPQDIVSVVNPWWNRDRECFLTVFLNVRRRILGIDEVAVGSLSQSIVHPREVFKAAILAGADAIVLAHNHPSGDPEPSSEDLEVTKTLERAGRILGIPVLDHIVFAPGGGFVSLAGRGVLKRPFALC